VNRLYVTGMRATGFVGRFELLRLALWALLHPRPTMPIIVRGNVMMDVRAGSLADIRDLTFAGLRHAIRGDSQFVLNHGVWVPGATAHPWLNDTFICQLPKRGRIDKAKEK
jgi:hypothetical protein